jgi:putative transposase
VPAVQGLSRSGFYAWQRRGKSMRRRSDEELGAAIVRIYKESRGAYGSRACTRIADAGEFAAATSASPA